MRQLHESVALDIGSYAQNWSSSISIFPTGIPFISLVYYIYNSVLYKIIFVSKSIKLQCYPADLHNFSGVKTDIKVIIIFPF